MEFLRTLDESTNTRGTNAQQRHPKFVPICERCNATKARAKALQEKTWNKLLQHHRELTSLKMQQATSSPTNKLDCTSMRTASGHVDLPDSSGDHHSNFLVCRNCEKIKAQAIKTQDVLLKKSEAVFEKMMALRRERVPPPSRNITQAQQCARDLEELRLQRLVTSGTRHTTSHPGNATRRSFHDLETAVDSLDDAFRKLICELQALNQPTPDLEAEPLSLTNGFTGMTGNDAAEETTCMSESFSDLSDLLGDEIAPTKKDIRFQALSDEVAAFFQQPPPLTDHFFTGCLNEFSDNMSSTPSLDIPPLLHLSAASVIRFLGSMPFLLSDDLPPPRPLPTDLERVLTLHSELLSARFLKVARDVCAHHGYTDTGDGIHFENSDDEFEDSDDDYEDSDDDFEDSDDEMPELIRIDSAALRAELASADDSIPDLLSGSPLPKKGLLSESSDLFVLDEMISQVPVDNPTKNDPHRPAPSIDEEAADVIASVENEDNATEFVHITAEADSAEDWAVIYNPEFVSPQRFG